MPVLTIKGGIKNAGYARRSDVKRKTKLAGVASELAIDNDRDKLAANCFAFLWIGLENPVT